MSKLANPSASRALRRGGEEGAKGSAKGSFAGREEEEEEEEKSPEVCGMKFPRRWKESEDSVRLMDDFLPDRAQTGKTQQRQVLFHEHCWHIPRRVIATLFQPNRTTGTFCLLDNRIN